MTEHAIEEGGRIGRFVVMRDSEGRIHAVAATAVSAICETDDGALLRSLEVVLRWLELGGR
jgi:hypothetical protein